MTTRAIRLLSTSSIALLVMSCSLLPQWQAERGQANRTAQRMPPHHIAQMDFGRDASFAVCTEPACPSVTPKSLSVAPDTAALPTTAIAATPAVDVALNAATTSNAEVPQPIADRAATEPAVTSDAERHQVIVQFMSGSATLTSSGKAALAQSLPTARKANRIVISGRTDSIGADNPNQSLALARAFNVRDYLRRREPTLSAVMVIEARGRCCFIASNDTPQGRRQNRRVEVVFNVPEQVTP
jgi:outer membrane protein OmpA-like peptidoglycan-associated protein